MKILYYFQELDTPMFQWHRTHIIDELTRHGVEVETFNPLLFRSVDEANFKVLELLSKGHYDLFMSNVCYFKMLYVDTVEAIKKSGVPTFTISWDNLMAPFIDEVLSPHFDLVWLTAKETERLYKKWKVHYFFAPYAANPYTYSYQPSSINMAACFVGNPHGSRAIMINTLTNAGVTVDLYCGGRGQNKKEPTIKPLYNIIDPSSKEIIINRFRFAEGRKLLMGSLSNKLKGSTKIDENPSLCKHQGLSHNEMVSTYSSAALCLASTSAGHTDALRNPLPIINLRNFEIPMCGGIEICKYNKELASYFEEGKEIVFYSSEEELVDKARYYTQKATDKEIYTIKEAARKRAEAEHTWWNRFKMAFDLLGLKYD
jgi:hypothetical protein